MIILKNITQNPIFINDTGTRIAANSSFTVQTTEINLWEASVDLIGYIQNGSIVVNDGIDDLSILEGIAYLTYPRRSKGIRYDNTTSGLVSKNTQDAIDELSTVSKIVPERTSDPTSPIAGETWVLKETFVGTPVGMLLSLVGTKIKYSLSYKTISGQIKRTELK